MSQDTMRPPDGDRATSPARSQRRAAAAKPPARVDPANGEARPKPGSAAIRIELVENRGPLPDPATLQFGRVFTDHMFAIDYHDGRWQDARIVGFAPLSLSPAAAGLHYGQTMFEGLKAFRGIDGKLRIFRLDRHIARMVKSAARLAMPAPEAGWLREAIISLCRTDARWIPAGPGTALYLRPAMIATEAFLGVRPAREYRLFVIASPAPAYFGAEGPLRLKLEQRYTRAAPGGLGAVKAGANYAASLRAAEDARAAGYAQVLWTDARHHQAIEEAGMMNVFVHLDDEIVTPPLRGTILAGVTRESVIDLLARWGHKVRERTITADELLEGRRTGRLHEMWGTGTGAGIASIGELGWGDERIVVGDGGEGPLARRLQPTLREIQTGIAEDPDGWMTEI